MNIIGTETTPSGEQTVNDYTFTIETNESINDRKVFRLYGGPTGYESFIIDQDTINRICEKGWVANAGGHKYPELRFSAEQMQAAFSQIEV